MWLRRVLTLMPKVRVAQIHRAKVVGWLRGGKQMRPLYGRFPPRGYQSG